MTGGGKNTCKLCPACTVAVGLDGLDRAVVGGGDVTAGSGAGEAVVVTGVTEMVVDGLLLAVPVDGCAEGGRLVDGELMVGEGGPLHAVSVGGTTSRTLWPSARV